MGDIHVLARSLREFERNDTVIKAVRTELRKPVPIVRGRIKATARIKLPHRGGLGAWVAGTKITAAVELGGKTVRIRLRGGRNSVANLRGGTSGTRSDIRAIDRGRVRHPHWGRRARGDWSTQSVPDGFFSRTAEESPEWGEAIDRGIVVALGELHG